MLAKQNQSKKHQAEVHTKIQSKDKTGVTVSMTKTTKSEPNVYTESPVPKAQAWATSIQGLQESQINLVDVVFYVQIWDANLSYISLKVNEINPKKQSDPYFYNF